MSNKMIGFVAALIGTCGCLALIVLALGTTAYFVFSDELGLSDMEIGITLPQVPAGKITVPENLLDNWLWNLNSPEQQADQPSDQAADQPAIQPEEESAPPLPQGSPEAENNEEARKECAQFAAAFPGLKLITAYKSDGLTCGFAEEGSQHYSGLVDVREFATSDEASQTWESEWGRDSSWAEAVDKYVEAVPERYTYVHEGDRFAVTYEDPTAGESSTYTTSAGRLYGNAIIEFSYERISTPGTESWEMAEGLAMELVDKHNAN